MTFRDKIGVSIIAFIALLAVVLIVTECSAQPVQARSPGARVYRVYAYCLQGVTASGEYTQPGTVAAPRNVPFGTIMYVPGYGYATVRDRMGARHPYDLDIWFESCWDARQWGVRWTTVTTF